jgi:hypothetical protein
VSRAVWLRLLIYGGPPLIVGASFALSLVGARCDGPSYDDMGCNQLGEVAVTVFYGGLLLVGAVTALALCDIAWCCCGMRLQARFASRFARPS